MATLEYVIYALAIVLFITFIVLWLIHFISIIYGKYKFHKKSKRLIESEKLPGVSIIKPLMGVDDNLLENLETFFLMDYPTYEILFCVQDHADPAITVAKTLMEKYPNIDAKLFSGGKNVGINPKINNMIQGYDVAKYELFLISDAGLKMAKDTLYDMVSLMTDKVGLVHQMPFVNDRPGFAGTLEKIYFGTCHCRMYLFINLLGINCVTGMSCLMRKNVIDKAGGLAKFGNYIAEDYFLAKEFVDNKWVIQLAHQPANQNSSNYSVPLWQKRMIRWCKLRLKLNIMSWLEPIQECFLLGICTCWTFNVLFGWDSLVVFLIHILGWFLCDYYLLTIVQNGKLPFTKFEFVIGWLYRETISYYLFLKAAINPTVKWRDGKYRLKWGGLAEEIKVPHTSTSNVEAPLVSNSSSIDQLKNQLKPALTTSLSLVNDKNSKKLNHKRTASSTIGLNNNSNTNLNIVKNANSDLEFNHPSSSSTSSILIASNSTGQLTPNRLNQIKNSNSSLSSNSNSNSSSLNSNRSQHQHHHSISNPIQYLNSN